MTQGDLAGEPDEEIQADGCDGIDSHVVDHIQHVGIGDEGHGPEEEHDADPHPEPAEIGAEDVQVLKVTGLKAAAGMKLEFAHVYVSSGLLVEHG